MDWFTDVEARMKRKNQILFSKNNALLFELDCLIKLQSHRTLILWSLDLADEAIQKEFIQLRDECGLDYKFPFEK